MAEKRLNVVNIRLDDALKGALKELADKSDRPLANYIVHVLREHVSATRDHSGPQ